MPITRREFIKNSAAATAAISFPMVAARSVLGANDEIRVGVIGLGNISYRLGNKATQAEMREQVEDVPIFNEMYDRFLAHLKAHEVDVDAKTVTLGPWLEIDRDNECFKVNNKANELVKGFYREPVIIPEV